MRPRIMARTANILAAEQAMSDVAAESGHGLRHAIGEAEALPDTPMTIGEVAHEFGITLRALRFYEAKRLVSPQRHGTTRFYRRGDRERIALILTGRRLGFTLTEISDLLGRPGGQGLRLNREKCVEQIGLLERQKRGIEVAIAELRQIYTSFYKPFLEDREPGTR